MPTTVEQRLIAQIYISLDGNELPRELQEDVMVTTIESSVHLPDAATIQVRNEDLKWSERDIFKPGQELKIGLGDADLRRPVFVGEVTAVELDLNMSGEVLLYVSAYDRAHRLHRGRFTRVFKQMTDSDIAKKIAGDLSFSANVEPTREVHEYVLQNNQTNWEFLQERAARLGFELQVREKTLTFKPPPSDPAEPVELAWRTQLLSFRARMTTGEQVGEVEVRGWNPVDKRTVVGRATRARGTPQIGERRSGGEVASSAFHQEARVVVAREPVYSASQADSLAQAALDELANTFVIAEGVALGDPRLRMGSEIDLVEVGKQFKGRYVVTEIRHVYEPEGYRIEFKVTGRRSTDMVSLLGPPPQVPIHVLTGVVTNNKDDRDLGRVKVKLPVLGDEIESHWCRLVTPGAGPERGLEYLPEVDDEVLVVGSDINHLYALGGLWNTKDAPPQKNSQAVSGGRVNKRIIRSRTGHVILLDDSDGGGSITVVDSTEKNKVVIDTATNSIELKAEGDIKVTAGGKLEMSAGLNVQIDAGTELAAKAGTSASVEGTTQIDLKGGAMATLQSNANTEVKGAMVNIGQ